MFTDSSSPVSGGHVFARTWRDLHAPEVPRMTAESLVHLDSTISSQEGRTQEQSLSSDLRTWIALARLGCQAGRDCNSPTGDLLSAPLRTDSSGSESSAANLFGIRPSDRPSGRRVGTGVAMNPTDRPNGQDALSAD